MKKKTVITTEKYEMWLIHYSSPVTAENETGSKQTERTASQVRQLLSRAEGAGEESTSDRLSPENDEGDSLENAQTATAGK